MLSLALAQDRPNIVLEQIAYFKSYLAPFQSIRLLALVKLGKYNDVLKILQFHCSNYAINKERKINRNLNSIYKIDGKVFFQDTVILDNFIFLILIMFYYIFFPF